MARESRELQDFGQKFLSTLHKIKRRIILALSARPMRKSHPFQVKSRSESMQNRIPWLVPEMIV